MMVLYDTLCNISSYVNRLMAYNGLFILCEEISMRAWLSMIVFTLLLSTGLSAVAAQDVAEPGLLSAFYGLDSALPNLAFTLCRQAPGKDGMPVIFSQEINRETLQSEDFAVITESGAVNTPVCAVLEPAVDPGELRTVLLVGELGSAESDPPVRVEVVGEILALDDSAQNFMGTTIEVTPLSAGPSLIYAESVPLAQWRLDQPSAPRQGNGCPSATTLQAVRVTWAGGVSNADGDEAGEVERALYQVTLRGDDGTESVVTPTVLADLGDNDNNHLLCLDVRGVPVTVSFPAGYLLDPNEDTLNPDTQVLVQIPAIPTESYRNVRYCEVVPTYRRGLTLYTEIWNTLGLNDCPADAWAALDEEAIKAELGAVNVSLNGPRYWVLDEIGAVGGVTVSGERATFGTLETELRATLETRLRGDLAGENRYTPMTVERDTRYVFYSGEYVYTLTDSYGDVYVMQSYAQIFDPELAIDDLTTLGERLTLPEGWTYQAVMLSDDFILLSGGEAIIVQDDLLNTYQMSYDDIPGMEP